MRTYNVAIGLVLTIQLTETMNRRVVIRTYAALHITFQNLHAGPKLEAKPRQYLSNIRRCICRWSQHYTLLFFFLHVAE